MLQNYAWISYTKRRLILSSHFFFCHRVCLLERRRVKNHLLGGVAMPQSLFLLGFWACRASTHIRCEFSVRFGTQTAISYVESIAFTAIPPADHILTPFSKSFVQCPGSGGNSHTEQSAAGGV